MKRAWKILITLLFIMVFIVPVFGQEDKESCKDHPMFTRMENFYLNNCEEQKFDAVDFKNEKGKKDHS